MATDKLSPSDERARYVTAEVRGKTYRYLLAEPKEKPIDTIVLCHGFPDIAFGWRYQIPFLASKGLRVVALEMLGYGGTDAPQALEDFSMKNMCDDLAELVRQIVGEGQVLLGGHDWGGAFVWRMAMWHPTLIRGVFGVCTPFNKPLPVYIPLEVVVERMLPNFGYQLKFIGPEVENKLQGAENIKMLLNSVYGGRGPNGEYGFSPTNGVLYDNLPLLKPGPLLSREELDHYGKLYTLHSAPELRGPLNWYRTREINFKDELPLVESFEGFKMPALFIGATQDTALPPSMSKGMEAHFTDLERRELDASHWVLWQKATEVNAILGDWIDKVHKQSSLRSSL